jgi:GNAT superfamily N-acetyltransferase
MLAVDGERVVGQYAAWRIDGLLERRTRPFMFALDAMVDPEFRRQGILTAMVQEAHRLWQAEGAACVLAMPNEQWGSVNEKVGWRRVFPLQWQIRPLRLEKIAMRRLGLALSPPAAFSRLWNAYWRRRLLPDPRLVLETVATAGVAFDDLWQRLRENQPLSTIRDAAWIQWRYLSVPDRSYRVLLARRDGRPVGYIVYWLQPFSGGEAGIVAEFLYETGDSGVRDRLVVAVLDQLQAAGAESLIGLAVPGTPTADVFKRVGAIFSWGAFDVWMLPLDAQADFSFLKQPENWSLHGGNFDII